MKISLTKYIEYYDSDSQSWKPLIWYSNREDSQYEKNFEGGLVEHSKFTCSVDKLTRLTDLSRGKPNDLSDFVKRRLEMDPNSYCGVSYYSVDELRKMEDAEEQSLLDSLKGGVEIELWSKDNEHPNVVRVHTIEELKRIHNIFTYLVYEVHGFVPDDQIRVIFYYN